MKDGSRNIDESIKVNSWGLESPTQHQSLFQKYAASSSQPEEGFIRQSPQFIQQVSDSDNNFRKIKNEQIQKLRTLKSEYEEIRKITTDYNGHRLSNTDSVRSSAVLSGSNSRMSEAGSKPPTRNGAYSGVGREYQIAELEKKQLQIMLENSMKKIEELLHSEMVYKKTIHELKLEKESKSFAQADNSGYSKILKKKEKEFYDQLRGLELERENLISSLATFREKVKYLEGRLTNSEQELRRVLEEKRNYEELIRGEKDKICNLEITLRREKREFEIMEKDKNGEISLLYKLKDIKENSTEKQLKLLVTNLQDEVKTKEMRYVLLLQQLENFQRDRVKQEKEQEAQLVHEIINKNSTDAPNKVLQQTISNILNRLNDLETKPLQPLTTNLFAGFMDMNQKDERLQPEQEQQEQQSQPKHESKSYCSKQQQKQSRQSQQQVRKKEAREQEEVRGQKEARREQEDVRRQKEVGRQKETRRQQQTRRLQQETRWQNEVREEREARGSKEAENVCLKSNLTTLERKVTDYEVKLSSVNQTISSLRSENTSLKLQVQNLLRQNGRLNEAEHMMHEQVERIKILETKIYKSTNKEVIHVQSHTSPPPPLPHREESSGKIEFLTLRISNLEKEIGELSSKLDQSRKEREAVEDENRSLLNRMSRAEFHMGKIKQESQMNVNLGRRSHEANYNIILQDLQSEKTQHAKAQREIADMRKYIQENTEAARKEMDRLHFNLERMQREKSSFDLQMKTNYNDGLGQVRSDYQGQIEKLTSLVKDLNLMNKELQEQYNKQQYLYTENEELKHSLKTMRITRRNEYPRNDPGNTPRRLDTSEVNQNIMKGLAQNYGDPQPTNDKDFFSGFN